MKLMVKVLIRKLSKMCGKAKQALQVQCLYPLWDCVRCKLSWLVSIGRAAMQLMQASWEAGVAAVGRLKIQGILVCHCSDVCKIPSVAVPSVVGMDQTVGVNAGETAPVVDVDEAWNYDHGHEKNT